MSVGKVYLVGAGPGHPDLLTLKGRELIGRADILIYDRLIQEDTLAPARADAERIYVGKAPGRHQSRQDQINHILVDAARRASCVVRLKGGDPVLFGRGGEEAEHLASHGIPFEVVPGVTAGLSVPMAAGIPVTHRDFSASVALVTGHRRDDRDTREIDWAALARLDTLVFFMSVGKLPDIAHNLIAHGCPPQTPGAIVQMAYWPGEQMVEGPLAELPELAARSSIRPPATIVIGQVVRMRDRLTTLHRELRRDVDEPVGFGLSAEALLTRLGSSLRSARDVRAAVRLRLFDALEQPLTAAELATRRKLQPAALTDVLGRLAGLGLLLRDEGHYRNAEAASRFLQTVSPEYIGPRLEQLLAEIESYDPMARLASAD